MKLSELIEKLKERPLADIARDELEIGEKTARRVLSHVGGRAVVGQSGWIADEISPQDMDRSIYSIADEVKELERERQKQAANQSDGQIVRKRHSFDLDVRLMKELKMHCVANDTTLYTAIEEAVKDYLVKHKGGEGIAE